jgi:hypothetical protein
MEQARSNHPELQFACHAEILMKAVFLKQRRHTWPDMPAIRPADHQAGRVVSFIRPANHELAA